MSKIYLPHIDGLRAISVLAVIFFHLDLKLFDGGYLGVDVFFVISGFLITRNILNSIASPNGFSLKSFYIRRFKRLGPALLTTSLFTFLISSLIFTPADLKRISGAMLSSLFSTSNIFFWLESDYFDVSNKIKPYLHTWSLSIEEQFYLFWPFFLILVSHKSVKKYRTHLITALTFLSFYLNHLFYDGNISTIIAGFSKPFSELFVNGQSTIFYLIPFRVFEFGIGGLLVFVFNEKKLKVKYHYDILLWLGMGLILYSFLFFDENLSFPYLRALAPCLGAALVIYSGHHAYTKRALESRPMVYIGLLSYSLYLTHWPIIVFQNYLLGKLTSTAQLFALIATFITAYFLHEKIEKPFRHVQLKKAPLQRNSILISALLIIIFGGHCYFSSGWTWRLSSQQKDIIDLKNSDTYHREYYGGKGYPRYQNLDQKVPPDIVLVGDSHARHYAEGLANVLSKENNLNIQFATGTSCLHLPNFTRKSAKINFDRICPERVTHVKSVMNLNKSNAPSVIMSHSWISQLSMADLLDDNNKAKKIDLNEQHLKQGLIEFKKMIGDSKLIIIGQVPGATIDLYSHYARPKISLFFTDNIDYRFTKASAQKAKLNLTLKEVAEQNEGIYFIDPHTAFCENGTCRNFDNEGHFLYSDTSHLSTFGSIYFFERLEDQFLQILQSKN